MTSSRLEEQPLVSMVVPVYNSITYLGETLDSLLNQGLSGDELEVILVNDGSDDGSERVVDEYAAHHPNFRVIHQEQSGGPATPCNVGVYAARGKYFFILGSDDVLTKNALKDLVSVAEREQSDVVLGRLGSIGGRRTPARIFKRTVYDADLVDHYIFNTLSAVKLFRTELVHRTGAHHPPSLRVGSDQPFVAALYLAARKFSICADRDYVMIRTREDGSNMTSTRRSSRDYMDLLALLLPVIVEGTDPGRVRDGVMRRPLRNTLTKVLKPSFSNLGRENQDEIVREIQALVPPLYNSVTAAHLDPLPRTKLELALDGDVDTLLAVMAWEKGGGSVPVVHNGSSFSYVLPQELASAVGEDRIYPPIVKGEVSLRGLAGSNSTLTIDLSARVPGCETAPDQTIFRLQNRGTGDEVDVSIVAERTVDSPSGRGITGRANIELGQLSEAVWDAYVVQCFGNDEVVNRFGAKKAEGVAGRSVYFFDGQGGQPFGKAYFTVGFGNLSLDIGFVHTKNELPEATVHGLVTQKDGSEIAIVTVDSGEPVEFLLRLDSDGNTRHLPVPSVQLDGQLHSLVLSPQSAGDRSPRRLVVRTGDRSRDLRLPAPIRIPAASRTGSYSRRDDERSADIFRAAVGDLGIVGRRAARRVFHGVRSLAGRSRHGR